MNSNLKITSLVCWDYKIFILSSRGNTLHVQSSYPDIYLGLIITYRFQLYVYKHVKCTHVQLPIFYDFTSLKTVLAQKISEDIRVTEKIIILCFCQSTLMKEKKRKEHHVSHSEWTFTVNALGSADYNYSPMPSHCALLSQKGQWQL